MEQIVFMPESRFRDILNESESRFRDILNEYFPKGNIPKPDTQITSLQQLAGILGVSVVTAQKIKNQLPKGSYLQVGRSFSISRNWLLTEYPKLQAGKRGQKC